MQKQKQFGKKSHLDANNSLHKKMRDLNLDFKKWQQHCCKFPTMTA